MAQSRGPLRSDEEAWGQRRPHPPSIRQVHGRSTSSRTRSLWIAWPSSFVSLSRLAFISISPAWVVTARRMCLSGTSAWMRPERWDVQARFWEAIAGRCAQSPAIFCYDLMNEPVVPGGRRKNGDWLGSPFAGKHFVQFITLDQRDRPRPVVAQQWVHHLTQAIRKQDRRAPDNGRSR